MSTIRQLAVSASTVLTFTMAVQSMTHSVHAQAINTEYGWSYIGSPQSGSTTSPTIPATTTYHGSIQLDWSSPENANHPFGRQQVRIVQHGHTLVNWPQAVSVYGEPTMVEVGGAEDNQIIGQEGEWLWLALKGPANPPFSGLPGHYYLFRYWDRIMAINIHSGTYRVFRIPSQTSPTPFDSTPQFANSGGMVYISIPEWLGVLPADPVASTQQIGIIKRMAPSLFAQRERQAERELDNETHAAATNIASFWDSYVMNKNVRGVQRYVLNGSVGLWFGDGAYINHGYMPYDVLWGAEFPLKGGSASYQQREVMLKALTVIAKNPIPTAWYLFNTATQMKAHFHATAPAPLPFFKISHGLYVPEAGTTS